MSSSQGWNEVTRGRRSLFQISMCVNVSELAARIFLIYFCALVGHGISYSSCSASVIFTDFTVETNTGSWVWVRWFCQPWSLWMCLMTQFSAVLEQCAIRNKRDVYRVVMVIVKQRKYLQACLKISRKVPGSTLWVGCVCLSVCNHCARGQVCTDLLWMLWEPLGAGLAAEN